MMDYQAQYDRYASLVSGALTIPAGVPTALSEAMLYSLTAGGKRIRGVLLLATCDMLGASLDDALPFAAAIEMLHTYSLIHDDLPALDNDDLRRGKPTCHKRFGEAMAILAGDGLQSLAMETMLCAPHKNAHAAAREIALRAGVRGMIAGQTMDVTLTGALPEMSSVRYIHAHKTADLLTAPVTAAMLLCGASEDDLSAGREYGYHMGLAFQIIDDLLDLRGDAATLGKTAGKDELEGKLTWPACVGEGKALLDAAEHTKKAAQALSRFDPRAEFLKTLAQNALGRVQ